MIKYMIVLMLLQATTFAADIHETQAVEMVATLWGLDPEKVTEIKQWDGSRVDLMAKGYAIEADWAKTGKVYEAVGQALYYSHVTGKPPAVLYMLKVGVGHNEQAQRKFVYRGSIACEKANVRVFVVKINVDTETVEEFNAP